MPTLKLDNSLHADSTSQVDKPLSPSTHEISISVDMKAPNVSAPIRIRSQSGSPKDVGCHAIPPIIATRSRSRN